MKKLILILAITATACSSAAAGTTPAVASRLNALESKVTILEMQIAEIQKTYFGVLPSGKPLTSAPAMPGYALDSAERGRQALDECRELRERVYPLFSQGAEGNSKMISCFAKTCP